MVELEYIFEKAWLMDACQDPGLVFDDSVSEWEMLMRLRLGDVEVFGNTESEYQRWLERLRRYKVTRIPPSSSWTTLSVLWIAMSISSAFFDLTEKGQAELPSLDCVIRMERHEDAVIISSHPGRIGRAPYADVQDAFFSFASRVRQDFLSVCPQLRQHGTLGWWFRGETAPSALGKPGNVILLPQAER